MRGPFPGMDPYLEDPIEWPNVHSKLIAAISDTLAAQVAPHFVVRTEQRVYIARSDDPGQRVITPDVYLVSSVPASPGISSATISTPVLIEPLYGEEVRDRYIEVRDVRNREVVTTLEVLSPANKQPGAEGREQFLRKRRAVLASATSWIEIDLLRAGERPPEVAGRGDYYALLKRGGRGGPYAVWDSDLRDPLPTIAVPLLPPHPDAALDLQAVLDGVYERAFYAVDIDYTRPVPPPPLAPADAAWAAARVRDWRSTRPEPAG